VSYICTSILEQKSQDIECLTQLAEHSGVGVLDKQQGVCKTPPKQAMQFICK
jgi:hypothetical protein